MIPKTFTTTILLIVLFQVQIDGAKTKQISQTGAWVYLSCTFWFQENIITSCQAFGKTQTISSRKTKEFVMKTMNYFQLNDYTVVYAYRISRSVWTSFGSRL